MDPEELKGDGCTLGMGEGSPGILRTLGLLRLQDCRACPEITATPLSHFLLPTCPEDAQEGVCKALVA